MNPMKIVLVLTVLLMSTLPVYGAGETSTSSGGWSATWFTGDITNTTVLGVGISNYINNTIKYSCDASYCVWLDGADVVGVNGSTESAEYSSTSGSYILGTTTRALPLGGNIKIGTGHFAMTSAPVLNKSNITYQGSGINSTFLDFGSDADAQLKFENLNNIFFKDMTITADTGIVLKRLYFKNNIRIGFENVLLIGGGYNFTDFMLYFGGNNYNIRLTNIEAMGSEDSPVKFYGNNTDIQINNYYAHDMVLCSCGDGLDLADASNVIVTNFMAENIPGSGIGMYRTRNVSIDGVRIKRTGHGTGAEHIGGAFTVSRWNDTDPSKIQVNNLMIEDTQSYGVHLFGAVYAPNNNTASGNLTDIVFSNVRINNTYLEGFALDGGNYTDVLVSDYVITNQADGQAPILFNGADSNYTRVRFSGGSFGASYTAFTKPSTVTISDTFGYAGFNHGISSACTTKIAYGAGDTCINATTGFGYNYNGSAWVYVVQTQIEEEFTGNGVEAFFATTYTPIIVNSTKVTNSTQRVRYGTGAGKYTANSTGVLFGTAPGNGESILVDYVI